MTKIVAAVAALLVLAAGSVLYLEKTKPTWYAQLRYPLPYEHIVVGHAENYDLDPALLAAVIYRESKFDPKAKSSSGAIGLMQLLPDTARGHRSSTPAATSSWSRISTTPRSTCATARSTSAG